MFFIENWRSISARAAALPRTRSRSSARPRWIAGSAARRRASASGAPVSTTVPLASTTVIASTVRYAVRAVPDDMPDELFATTPPIVHAISLAGSGPRRRPCRSRCALTSRSVAPGSQRTRSPPSSTSTRVKRVRVSTSTPAPDAWPDRLVPPERNVTGSPRRVASRIAATTPSRSCARTTTSGRRR